MIPISSFFISLFYCFKNSFCFYNYSIVYPYFLPYSLFPASSSFIFLFSSYKFCIFSMNLFPLLYSLSILFRSSSYLIVTSCILTFPFYNFRIETYCSNSFTLASSLLLSSEETLLGDCLSFYYRDWILFLRILSLFSLRVLIWSNSLISYLSLPFVILLSCCGASQEENETLLSLFPWERSLTEMYCVSLTEEESYFGDWRGLKKGEDWLILVVNSLTWYSQVFSFYLAFFSSVLFLFSILLLTKLLQVKKSFKLFNI